MLWRWPSTISLYVLVPKRLIPFFPQDLITDPHVSLQANAYAPGIVDTPMWDLIDSELGKKQGKAKGEVMKFYVKELTALSRPSEAVDVGRMVGFLASSDSNFVTGQTQLVDGGIIYT